MSPSTGKDSATRRHFIQATAAAGVAAALPLSQSAYAAGGDMLRVGLIGCGGRGTGACRQALQADKNVQLTAMGDAFEDRLETSLKSLERIESISGKIAVPPENRFVGFDAYKNVIANSDVVLLTTPPHFRPIHLKAAIDAGKHVFAEKPVAVDGPGVRSVLETCRLAKEKKLSVVSGLCLRYSYGYQEIIRRIAEGEIGEVHTVQSNDYRGKIWVRPRKEEWSDMTWQMRNWYYFTWLSGDFNVEQHVHHLDVGAWAAGGYPVAAVGMGGRIVRNAPEFGNIFDHHSVVYEYENGIQMNSNTRQMSGCHNNNSVQVYGSKGMANFSERKGGLYTVVAGKQSLFEGESNPFYQTEHDELFAGIRSGNPINNGEYMSHSTLLGIQGRMATYTGQRVTWEQALNSQEDLSPPAYTWDAVPTYKIAVPGVTRVV
ncbi:MAG: Gfo/Idh/MocA family oxidoreductase [bacterium]|nr:Gfo/Idh/MocA family oxidoreductase [bacterium]